MLSAAFVRMLACWCLSQSTMWHSSSVCVCIKRFGKFSDDIFSPGRGVMLRYWRTACVCVAYEGDTPGLACFKPSVPPLSSPKFARKRLNRSIIQHWTQTSHSNSCCATALLLFLGEGDYLSLINPVGSSQETASPRSRCHLYFSSLYSPDNALTHTHTQSRGVWWPHKDTRLLCKCKTILCTHTAHKLFIHRLFKIQEVIWSSYNTRLYNETSFVVPQVTHKSIKSSWINNQVKKLKMKTLKGSWANCHALQSFLTTVLTRSVWVFKHFLKHLRNLWLALFTIFWHTGDSKNNQLKYYLQIYCRVLIADFIILYL